MARTKSGLDEIVLEPGPDPLKQYQKLRAAINTAGNAIAHHLGQVHNKLDFEIKELEAKRRATAVAREIIHGAYNSLLDGGDGVYSTDYTGEPEHIRTLLPGVGLSFSNRRVTAKVVV